MVKATAKIVGRGVRRGGDSYTCVGRWGYDGVDNLMVGGVGDGGGDRGRRRWWDRGRRRWWGPRKGVCYS